MMKIGADVFWTEWNSLVNETVNDVLGTEPKFWIHFNPCGSLEEGRGCV